jgi:hypothetical protein
MLDDSGFHHSVLADFRDRLTQGDRADRLLDLALARLKEAGLVRERGTHGCRYVVLVSPCPGRRILRGRADTSHDHSPVWGND